MVSTGEQAMVSSEPRQRQLVDKRALARIIVTVLEGIEERFGIEALGLHMHPAAEMIVGPEMGIVGGEGGEAAAFGEQLIEQIPAVAAVAIDGAAVIVDLDRVGDSRWRGRPRS